MSVYDINSKHVIIRIPPAYSPESSEGATSGSGPQLDLSKQSVGITSRQKVYAGSVHYRTLDKKIPSFRIRSHEVNHMDFRVIIQASDESTVRVEDQPVS